MSRQYTRRTFESKWPKTCFSCSKTNQVGNWTTFVRTRNCDKNNATKMDFVILVSRGFAKGILSFDHFRTPKNRVFVALKKSQLFLIIVASVFWIPRGASQCPGELKISKYWSEQRIQIITLVLARPNSTFRHPPPSHQQNDTAEVCFYPLETIVFRQSYSNKEGGGTLVQKILFDSVSFICWFYFKQPDLLSLYPVTPSPGKG